MYETNFTKKDMTEICPVCNKEITSANREQYKFSSESQALPVHDFCLGKFASKPKGYFEERRKILAIEEKKALEKEQKDFKESRNINKNEKEITELKERLQKLEEPTVSNENKPEKENYEKPEKNSGCSILLLFVLLAFIGLMIITSGPPTNSSLQSSGSSMTPSNMITRAHQEYAKRHLGYKSSHLPRPGVTRGDDYRNCIDQKYNRSEDAHDFCAWHAGIGKYQ